MSDSDEWPPRRPRNPDEIVRALGGGIDPSAVARAIGAIVVPSAKIHEQLRRQWTLPAQRFSEQFAAMGESMKRTVAAALPPNWNGRDVGEIDRILSMSEETGLNTVWVPRLDVIRELLAADGDDARSAVLTERRGDILDDVATCLEEVTYESLTEEMQLARAALAAVRAGHDAPGQALAASVLSGLVHDCFAFERFADARQRFVRDDPDHVGLPMFRITAILRTFGRALTKTDEADPGFNRHASLHAHEGQYTSSHAMAALLLLAGVLREADHLLYRQERMQSEGARDYSADTDRGGS